MLLSGRERFGRRCDAVVHAGVITLLAFSPLAFGAVHQWSQAIVQLLAVGLIAVWASKLRVCGSTAEANERMRRWRWPLACFGVIALLQLVPLPPLALRVISPNTAAIYRRNLPGWPDANPFGEVMQTVAALHADVAPNAGGDSLIAQVRALADNLPSMMSWRPLSVYPYRSGEESLLMLTWAAVFFCSSDIPGTYPATRWRHARAPGSPSLTTDSFLASASG